MLLFAALSAFVLLLVFKVGDPDDWRRQDSDAQEIHAQARLEQPDERGPGPSPPAGAAVAADVPPIEPADDELAAEKPAQEPTARKSYFPGVRDDYLRDVRDDTVFRAAESDAWFHLLAILAESDGSQLAAASLGRVGYLQLDQQPATYRGQVVTIGGVARGAKLVRAPANGYGVDEYYQLWVQCERNSPALVVLYCLELPKGFPLGTQLDATITATGFFYKRWAYASQGGITTAPLVLARTLAWQPPSPAEHRAPARAASEQFLLAVMGALVLAGATIAFVVWRGRTAEKPREGAAAKERVAQTLASLEAAPHDTAAGTISHEASDC